MSCQLFLDTARMGRASYLTLAAQAGLCDYWARSGLSAEFDQFLHEGFDAGGTLRRIPALSAWRGMTELKESLRILAGLGPGWRTLMSNRASKLMEIPLSILQQRRERIMCFYSLWPQYRERLLPATAEVFHDAGITQNTTLIEAASEFFEEHSCRGIVMPAVTHFGRVIPYAAIIKSILRSNKLELVVIDGAQEFCQMPMQDLENLPVFYVTCSQKWLRSGSPTGIAFVSENVCWEDVVQTVDQIDDPLLQFTCGGGADNWYGETVAVAPLIACRAAVDQSSPDRIIQDHRARFANRLAVRNLMCDGNTISSSRDSGILTVDHNTFANLAATRIRQSFLELGIVLSAFPGGLIRMSMPEYELTASELGLIEAGFDRLSQGVRSSS